MSLKIDDRIKAEVDTMQKKKDKVFISRMVVTLTKLEIKYLTTRHKKKRLVIDMAPTKQIEKALPAKHAWGSFETDDESNEDETETSIISQFESWNFTNVPNPNVSSDVASTEAKDDQSDLDVVKCVNTSDESITRTFISLPLDRGSPIYQKLASSPSPPTARSSSTTDLMLEPSSEVVPRMPAAPLLPTLSPTRPSVINCPAGTCDEQSIYSNPLRVGDVSLEPNDDVIDQVPIEAVPSPGDGPVVQQEEETVPVPPPLTLSVKTVLSARCVELTTGLYTGIVKKERKLGCMAERATMLGSPSFRPGRRETRRAPRRRWRTESAGVRQTHSFIVFQIVYRCLKMTG